MRVRPPGTVKVLLLSSSAGGYAVAWSVRMGRWSIPFDVPWSSPPRAPAMARLVTIGGPAAFASSLCGAFEEGVLPCFDTASRRVTFRGRLHGWTFEERG